MVSDLGFGNTGDLTIGDEKTYIVNTSDQHINRTDFIRLNKQNALVNPEIGLFPSSYVPQDDHVILDLACGPGGWVRDVARTYPKVRLVGIDNNKIAISAAKYHEQTRYNQNVYFDLADIMRRLPFQDNLFDCVNARFIVTVIPKTRWVPLLQECFRILKPGGVIRLVEFETGLVAGCPNLHLALDVLLEVLWITEKSYARHSITISPMLPVFLRDAGFEGDQLLSYYLDWSHGTSLHRSIVEDTLVSMQLLRETFLKMRSMTDGEFDMLYQQVDQEMKSKHFSAVWPIVSASARKPI